MRCLCIINLVYSSVYEMKSLFCLLFVAVCCDAYYSPGLRVRFAMGLQVTKTFFKDVPRHQADIIKKGWVQVPRFDGAHFPTLAMYCPADDYHLCAMYDDAGYMAGLQISLGVDEYTDYAFEPTSIGMRLWTVQMNGETKNFWANPQYFVNEEYMALSADARAAKHNNGEITYSGGAWVTNLDGTLLKIDSNVSNIMSASSGFVDNRCLILMGRHYFYNLTKESSCTEPMLPWFALVHGEDLVGSGFTTFGKMPKAITNEWFETPSSTELKLILKNAPECIYDMVDTNGVVSMHIYYVNAPWTIGCLTD